MQPSPQSILEFSFLVQSLSCVQLFVTSWTAAHQASLSIESVMSSNYLILCHPLLFLPSVFPSIRVFSNESVLHVMWPKYWSFSFNMRPSNEHSGLISFRMNWLDLLAAQGTLKSLLQYHSSKASILQHSTFFMVQLSHIMPQRNPVPHCQHPKSGLSCGPQRYVHLESQKVTLFGMRVLVDVSKVRIVRYDHSGLGFLKPVMSVFLREKKTTQRHREEAV